MAAIRDQILPAVETCGAAEINGILAGLDGRFVPPGPSGAPTRGRVVMYCPPAAIFIRLIVAQCQRLLLGIWGKNRRNY